MRWRIIPRTTLALMILFDLSLHISDHIGKSIYIFPDRYTYEIFWITFWSIALVLCLISIYEPKIEDGKEKIKTSKKVQGLIKNMKITIEELKAEIASLQIDKRNELRKIARHYEKQIKRLKKEKQKIRDSGVDMVGKGEWGKII